MSGKLKSLQQRREGDGTLRFSSSSRHTRVSTEERSRILLAGPVPPPIHGASLMFDLLKTILTPTCQVDIASSSVGKTQLHSLSQVSVRNLITSFYYLVVAVTRLVVTSPALTVLFISEFPPALLRDVLIATFARILHRPLIVYVHGSKLVSSLEGLPLPFRALGFKVLCDAQEVWVLTDQVKRDIQKRIPQARTWIIPDPLIDAPPPPSPRRFIRRPPRIGTITNLKVEKGVLLFLEAVSLYPEDCEVVLGGPFVTRNDEKRILDAMENCPHAVRLLGPLRRKEVYETLDSLDLFVFPSRFEGQGIVVLEALSRGLPTVASDVGGAREAIGEAGVVLHEPTPQDLASAIASLLSDDSEYSKRSEVALRRAGSYSRSDWEHRVRSRIRTLISSVQDSQSGGEL